MDLLIVVIAICCALSTHHLADSSGGGGSGSEMAINQFPSIPSPDVDVMLYIEEPWSTKKFRKDPSGGVSEKCMKLLEVFTNATGTYLKCIMINARPLHYCENCVGEFTSVINAYNNICNDNENGTTCRDQLLRADNVQVVLLVFNFVDDIWDRSSCHNCYNATVINGTTFYKPTKETVEMLKKIVDVQSCFQDFGGGQLGNQSVCHMCAVLYVAANVYYNELDAGHELCSDLEDSMNYTRRMWSKDFKCDVGVRTNVVIWSMAIAIGFLPVFFYIGAYFGTQWEIRRTRLSLTREVGDAEEREPINMLGTSGET